MLPLIDGDVIAYMACKNRYVTKTGDILVLDAKDQIHFSKEEDAEYLRRSWKNFLKEIEDIKDTFYSSDCLIAIKSPTNFRDDMYNLYKANRRKAHQFVNNFVPVMRKLASFEGIAAEAHYREADDLLRMWAGECARSATEYVVVSIDKDLKCIAGNHYNPKTKELKFVSEEDALRFFYQQLLSGDPTDNIPGIPGIGEVRASNMVRGFDTEEELQEIVIDKYRDYFGEDLWYEMLLSNGKMIHLQKHEDDWFDLQKWPIVRKMGVIPRHVLREGSIFGVAPDASAPQPPQVGPETTPDGPRRVPTSPPPFRPPASRLDPIPGQPADAPKSVRMLRVPLTLSKEKNDA